jgi:hypothetical protein
VPNTPDTTRSLITGGGGPYLFIALPLIGMGTYLIYLGIGQTIFLIIGPIFLLLGSLLAIFREGITLDRLHGTATQWRKLVSRKIIAVHNLSEFRTIEIEMHRAAKSTSFIVSLAGTSKKVVVNYPISVQSARTLANDIANFLSISVVDKTMNQV